MPLPVHQDIARRGAAQKHMHQLGNANSCNSSAFIRNPVATKEMWDGVQAGHPKTLSLCFVVTFSSKKPNIPILYRDILEEIMECRTQATPLHLKIAAWHDNLKCIKESSQIANSDEKIVLMPRQALLNKLDPLETLSVPKVCEMLAPYLIEYQQLILQDRPVADMDIKGALQILQILPQTYAPANVG